MSVLPLESAYDEHGSGNTHREFLSQIRGVTDNLPDCVDNDQPWGKGTALAPEVTEECRRLTVAKCALTVWRQVILEYVSLVQRVQRGSRAGPVPGRLLPVAAGTSCL